MKTTSRKHRMKHRAKLPCAATSGGADLPPTTANEVASLRFPGHRAFYSKLQAVPEVGNDSAASGIIDALTGMANAADDRNAAALRMNEVIASDVNRRGQLERGNADVQFSHIRLRMPGSCVPSRYALLDLTIAYEFTRMIKGLSSNMFWTMVPAIVMMGSEQMLEYALEGMAFEERLNAVLDERIGELTYRLNRTGDQQAVTVTHLDREEQRIARKIRTMFCVSSTHLPSTGETDQDARAAHRLLHVRAMMEVKQLTKFDTGEGKVHMYAALNATKAHLPDRAAARSSGAPKARRARDIGYLQRMTGFADYELPYIKR